MLKSHRKKLKERGEVILRLKVHPGARKTLWRGIMADDTIKLDIKSPAVDNRANRELLNLLAAEFSLPVRCLKIISGKNDRFKVVKIKNLPCQT